MILNMGMEYQFIPMDPNMMAIGRMICLKVLENLYLATEIIIKVIGYKINSTEMAYMYISIQDKSIQDNGRAI